MLRNLGNIIENRQAIRELVKAMRHVTGNQPPRYSAKLGTLPTISR
jgi:hypothetical protein